LGVERGRCSRSIAKEVGEPDLKDKLKVEVVGDSVKIRGTVPSQEIKEKVILAAGNVEGVSKVEEELRTTEKKPEAVVHTVVKGDTLWAIAKKSYSDGSKYKLIFLRQIGRCSSILRKIYPGQVLRIPPLENEA
jgi:nucleoid-associated protein YgaU